VVERRDGAVGHLRLESELVAEIVDVHAPGDRPMMVVDDCSAADG
jgi:hypothetical protein